MTYPFLSVVKQDFQAVDDLIRANLNSEVPMVEEIAAYLIEAGENAFGLYSCCFAPKPVDTREAIT